MAFARRDLTGEIIDRRYRVEHELGRGGMGVVWSVQHIESLQRLALKTLESELAAQPPARERLLREARAAASLRSRHVVRVVDAHMSYLHRGEPLPFLVMEQLEGMTLEQWLATRGKLDRAQLTWTVGQVARALAAAHEQGIVHRDLKPSNVFLTTDEEGQPLVKLCDFGIAKLLDAAAAELLSSEAATTSTGEVLGTPLYLAPELLRGGSRATPATDQWALGLTVFKALTGREYFSGVGSGPELVLKIAHDPMTAPSTIDSSLGRDFDAWFLRSCDRDPAGRFDGVLQQLTALHAALGRPEPIAPAIDAGARPEARVDPEMSVSTSAAVVPMHPAPTAIAPPIGRASFLRRVALAFGLLWAGAGAAYLLAFSPIAGVSPRAPAPLPARAGASDLAPSAVPAPAAPRDSASPGDSHPAAAAPIASESIAPPPARAGRPEPEPARARPRPAAVHVPKPAPSPAEHAPAPKPGRAGDSCARSAECESGLCVAERCR